ncbi:hypothetical protein ACIPL1_10325 [Pseudomonas sp. NPDC090202]|uniref:hypothetical protein n=1 Tax=unclassified Pseudomonas TaxID=196821 RepID=UPI003801BDB2
MVTQANRNDPALDPQKTKEQKDREMADNSYTPDFKPEEHESPDTTKEENQTGETDRDIDTAGG